MPLPEKPGSVLLINDREIKEATPVSLWRKANHAAVLDFEIPRRTFLSLRDVEGEFRQGSVIQLFYGQLEDKTIELGTSASSFLIPEGKEIGGLVADIVQNTIDAQFAAPAFSIQGIHGTNPV